MTYSTENDAGCGCYACIGDKPAYEDAWLTIGMSRMIVCAECGNKRCPHGTDHRNACTGSNEPGQEGSRYGTAIRTLAQRGAGCHPRCCLGANIDHPGYLGYRCITDEGESLPWPGEDGYETTVIPPASSEVSR